MACVKNFFIRNEISILVFEEEKLMIERIFQCVEWTMNYIWEIHLVKIFYIWQKKKKKGKLKRQFSVKRTTSYVREISLLQGNFWY